MPKKSERKANPNKQERKPKLESKKLSETEYEKAVLDLSSKGLTTEKIGLELAKQGIHPKEHKIKISRILKKHKIYSSPDIINIEKKVEKIKLHAGKNKQDKRALRELVRVTAQLRRTKEYNKVQL